MLFAVTSKNIGLYHLKIDVDVGMLNNVKSSFSRVDASSVSPSLEHKTVESIYSAFEDIRTSEETYIEIKGHSFILLAQICF